MAQGKAPFSTNLAHCLVNHVEKPTLARPT